MKFLNEVVPTLEFRILSTVLVAVGAPALMSSGYMRAERVNLKVSHAIASRELRLHVLYMSLLVLPWCGAFQHLGSCPGSLCAQG